MMTIKEHTARVDLRAARQHLVTARRGPVPDPEFADAAEAALQVAQVEHDEAVLQLALAQRSMS